MNVSPRPTLRRPSSRISHLLMLQDTRMKSSPREKKLHLTLAHRQTTLQTVEGAVLMKRSENLIAARLRASWATESRSRMSLMELTSCLHYGRRGRDIFGQDGEGIGGGARPHDVPLARRSSLSRTWDRGLAGGVLPAAAEPGGGEFGRADGGIGAWLAVGDRSGATWMPRCDWRCSRQNR